MTASEQKAINELNTTLSQIRQENNKFREDITKQVNEINSKVEAKHMPIYHEQDILKTAQAAIGDAIKACLVGYNNPLSKLCVSVVDEHSKELRQIINDSFSSVIKTEEFKESIVSAFSHKVAKTIISNNEGLFDKVSNELKQDVQFKIKMSAAVVNVVNECLLEGKKV